MPLYFNTFTSIHIYTFPSIDFCQFESTQTFYLDKLFGSQSFLNKVKHTFRKKFGFLSIYVMLLT